MRWPAFWRHPCLWVAMEEGSLKKQATQGYLRCRSLKLGEMNPTLSVHSTEEQSGRKSWRLLRAAVILLPSRAVYLSQWVHWEWQCQVFFHSMGKLVRQKHWSLPFSLKAAIFRAGWHALNYIGVVLVKQLSGMKIKCWKMRAAYTWNYFFVAGFPEREV